MTEDVKKSSIPDDTFLVRPLNAGRETLGVAAALAVILVFMTIRFALIGGGTQQQYMRPYQRLDSLLEGTQRTLFQTLLNSVSDIVYLRDQEGQWPETALLEMEEVPPFAAAFLPKELQGYAWMGNDGGTWIDYIGNNPVDPKANSFILRVIDLHADYHPHPHPGLDYDPNQKVAVQIWIYPEPQRPFPGERLPEAGWWWVVGPDDPSLRAPAQDMTPPTAPKQEGEGK